MKCTEFPIPCQRSTFGFSNVIKNRLCLTIQIAICSSFKTAVYDRILNAGCVNELNFVTPTYLKSSSISFKHTNRKNAWRAYTIIRSQTFGPSLIRLCVQKMLRFYVPNADIRYLTWYLWNIFVGATRLTDCFISRGGKQKSLCFYVASNLGLMEFMLRKRRKIQGQIFYSS